LAFADRNTSVAAKTQPTLSGSPPNQYCVSEYRARRLTVDVKPGYPGRVPAESGSPKRLTDGDWYYRRAVPDRHGNKIYSLTFKRLGRIDAGNLGSFDVPKT